MTSGASKITMLSRQLRLDYKAALISGVLSSALAVGNEYCCQFGEGDFGVRMREKGKGGKRVFTESLLMK